MSALVLMSSFVYRRRWHNVDTVNSEQPFKVNALQNYTKQRNCIFTCAHTFMCGWYNVKAQQQQQQQS